jgi:hypothetical protein
MYNSTLPAFRYSFQNCDSLNSGRWMEALISLSIVIPAYSLIQKTVPRENWFQRTLSGDAIVLAVRPQSHKK